jgi:mono/diheme cytochrome c family protein
MRYSRWFERTSLVLIMSSVVACLGSASVADVALQVTADGEAREFSRDALLARSDVQSIEIPADIAYGKSMRFRAVPLAELLKGFRLPSDGVIETVARDGFVAHVPIHLITNTDHTQAIAWLAIEPSDAPWPALPGKSASAGPFYIVWTGVAAKAVSSEQWAYQVVKLASQLPPAARWPEIAVDSALPGTDQARAGQALFITQCLPCHTINGAGSGNVGPDMNNPMNPTQYLTRSALHALIRDPKSVRTWPTQIMPGFSQDQMSDQDIEAVITYLAHMALRKRN